MTTQQPMEAAGHQARTVGVPAAPIRILASGRLTLLLLLAVGGALAYGNHLQKSEDLETAQWVVYRNTWFIVLLGALMVNMAAKMLLHLAGRRIAAIIMPAGLLILLGGYLWTQLKGIEGQLMLWRDGPADSVMLTHRSQLTLLSPHGKGTERTELCFSPGPSDWRREEPLEFSSFDGPRVKVLRFMRHALFDIDFVEDNSPAAKPAILVSVTDEKDAAPRKVWHLPALFGVQAVPGQLTISVWQAPAATLLEDFLHAPELKAGGRGILRVHYKDHVYPLPIDEGLPKTIRLGDGINVEVLSYYANAMSTKGKFESDGDAPKNPMLQIAIHMPGQDKPVEEYAYANSPFVTREAIKRQPCPVHFWYHHPATVANGAEFLQTPDNRLHCRVAVNGHFQPRGEVKEGQKIDVPDNAQLTLLRHIAHAKQSETYASAETEAAKAAKAEAAAEIEVSDEKTRQHFWLERNDARFGVRKIEGFEKPLIVMFGYERSPLGFAVKLDEFERDKDPAKCVSHVQFSAPGGDAKSIAADGPRWEISAKHPVLHGGFTFSQEGYRQLPGKVDMSLLRVTSDPGRILKYVGGVIFCLGLLTSPFRRRRPAAV